MRLRFWHKEPERTRDAEHAAQESHDLLRTVREQWPKVRQDAEWSRQTRSRNHLTDLFYGFRGGKS